MRTSIGFRIDLDRGDMRRRRSGAEHRIVGLGGGEFVAGVRRQPAHFRIDRARHVAEGDEAIGAGDGNFAVFGDEIGGGGLEKMRGGVEHFVAHRLRGERRRAAGQHHAAAGIGAGAAAHGGAVALHDADVFDADAEMFGDDLGQRGLETLAVRGDAERRSDGAGRNRCG